MLDQQIAVPVGERAIGFKCEEIENERTRTHTEIKSMNISAHIEYVVSCGHDLRVRIQQGMGPYAY